MRPVVMAGAPKERDRAPERKGTAWGEADKATPPVRAARTPDQVRALEQEREKGALGPHPNNPAEPAKLEVKKAVLAPNSFRRHLPVSRPAPKGFRTRAIFNCRI